MSNCIEIIIWKLSVSILCYSSGGQCNCLSAIVFERGMCHILPGVTFDLFATIPDQMSVDS